MHDSSWPKHHLKGSYATYNTILSNMNVQRHLKKYLSNFQIHKLTTDDNIHNKPSYKLWINIHLFENTYSCKLQLHSDAVDAAFRLAAAARDHGDMHLAACVTASSQSPLPLQLTVGL